MKQNKKPAFSIVVLCFNHFNETTKPCLEKIIKSKTKHSFEIVVVDNASNDGTQDFLRKFKKENNHINIQLIFNTVNKGFSAGNNDGIDAATGDLIVLLNNDTLVSNFWLDKFYKHLDQNKNCGLAAPITNYAGTEQKINFEGLTETNYEKLTKAYTLINKGAFFKTNRLSFFCVVFRKNIIGKVGKLDPIYSIGMFEDDDYCQRVANFGYSIDVLKDCFIYHKGSATFKYLSSEEYSSLFNKNRLLYKNKFCLDWSFTDVALNYLNFFKGELTSSKNILSFKNEFLLRYDDVFKLLVLVKEREMNFINAHPYDKNVSKNTNKLFLYLFHFFKNKSTEIKKVFFYFFIKLYFLGAGFFKKVHKNLQENASVPLKTKINNPMLMTSIFKKIRIEVIESDEFFYIKNKKKLKYSIIATVLNEIDNIDIFTKSIFSQSVRPHEVVIVDGGSNDGTYEFLKSLEGSHKKYNFTIIQKNKCNVAQGRNLAIRHTSNELIVLLDAGSRFSRNFCKQLLHPIIDNPLIDLVSGLTLPESDYPSGWIANKVNYIGYDFTEFLPSARSVLIRRSIYNLIDGGFPEYLTRTGEDTLFMVLYRNVSRHWLINKKANVIWKNPDNLLSLNQLKASYSFGDGESGFGDRNLDSLMKTTQGMSSYYLGKMNRPLVEKRRGVYNASLIFSVTPFELLNDFEESFIKKLINNKHKVFYIQDCYSDLTHDKKILDFDFTLLEIYMIQLFDLEDFCELYHGFNISVYDHLKNKKSFGYTETIRRNFSNVEIFF
ncbi:glycosyltransferase [Candidatus Methylopumilus universalis]|uniref:glycosyltransferase family 2 protein n=1 Tax=Candidatus Methylopumilus universalis TaxID=2588536 RepID=UPI001122C5A5|nr:glycosyltransferase [Candidatus Methylopumilus universalis]QDC96506.1 glycosyltransferase [Candidatus Methylopumilus universalis]